MAEGGKSADAIGEVNDALDQSSGSEDNSMDSGSDGSSSEDDQAAPGPDSGVDPTDAAMLDEDEGYDGSSSSSEDEEDRRVFDESESDGEGQPSNRPAGLAGGPEGPASSSFARAFARLVPEGEDAAVGILSGSKRLAKRQAEEKAEGTAERSAKKARMEATQKAHVKVQKKGANPEADAKERGLQRLATRGVVQMFNAVGSAQRKVREAAAARGRKAGGVTKASIVAELKGLASQGGIPAAPAGTKMMPIGGPMAGGVGAGAGAAAGQRSAEEASVLESKWTVLQEGLPGIAGSNKLKDWDQQDSEEDAPAQQLAGLSDDDDEEEDADGW